MILGLAGAHRSGKSTLAKDIAARTGIAYYDGSFGRIARTFGYDSVAAMSPFERITMQFAVLERFAAELKAHDGPVVTDRTPVDMLAYMLAEVGMHAGLDEGTSHAIVRYRARCIADTQALFTTVFLVQPLPVYEVADGKPSGDPAYQIHIQTLIEGGLYALRDDLRIVTVDATDHAVRMDAILRVVDQSSDEATIGTVHDEERRRGFEFGSEHPYAYGDFGRGFEVWHRESGAIVWRYGDDPTRLAAAAGAEECRRRNGIAAAEIPSCYGIVAYERRGDGYYLGLWYPYIYGLQGQRCAVWDRESGEIIWISEMRCERWGDHPDAQHAAMMECMRQNRLSTEADGGQPQEPAGAA